MSCAQSRIVSDWSQKQTSPPSRWGEPQLIALMLPESTTSKPKEQTTETKYFCPVCKKPLERYDDLKDNLTKTWRRCSGNEARNKSNHQQVVFSQLVKGIGGAESSENFANQILRIAIDLLAKPHQFDYKINNPGKSDG